MPKDFRVEYGDYLVLEDEYQGVEAIPLEILHRKLTKQDLQRYQAEIATFGSVDLSGTPLRWYTDAPKAASVELVSGYGVYPPGAGYPVKVLRTEQAAQRWVDQRYGEQWRDGMQDSKLQKAAAYLESTAQAKRPTKADVDKLVHAYAVYLDSSGASHQTQQKLYGKFQEVLRNLQAK
jgi:hypothetical protein